MATQKETKPMETKSAGTKKVRKQKLGEDKKANFRAFATARTNKVMRALKALSNCGNKASYEADAEQIDKIEKVLIAKVAETMAVLRKAPKEKAKEFEL